MVSEKEVEDSGALGWLRNILSIEQFQRAAKEHNDIVCRIRAETKAERDELRARVEKLEAALKQLLHNGDHFRCEVGYDNACKREGGDSMSKCQTCVNKWQVQEALAQPSPGGK